MRTLETKQGNNLANTALDQGILQLIQESGSGSGLEGLINFESKLTKEEKKLTPSEVISVLKQTMNDIQNPDFLSFESGERDGKIFGFEGVGTDVIPTVTPNGDCIIPLNFRYDGQRRTILLVLEITFDGKNHYRLPAGDNFYRLTVGKNNFDYELVQEQEAFRMIVHTE